MLFFCFFCFFAFCSVLLSQYQIDISVSFCLSIRLISVFLFASVSDWYQCFFLPQYQIDVLCFFLKLLFSDYLIQLPTSFSEYFFFVTLFLSWLSWGLSYMLLSLKASSSFLPRTFNFFLILNNHWQFSDRIKLHVSFLKKLLQVSHDRKFNFFRIREFIQQSSHTKLTFTRLRQISFTLERSIKQSDCQQESHTFDLWTNRIYWQWSSVRLLDIVSDEKQARRSHITSNQVINVSRCRTDSYNFRSIRAFTFLATWMSHR